MTPQPPELAKNLFDVLATGDPGIALRTVGESFRNREASVAPVAASIPGPAGLLASSAWMRFAFSELQFPISDLIHDDDRVWIRLRMQGLQTGAFVQFYKGKLAQAVPPTNRRIDFEQVHLLTLRDGLIVDHQAVRDDITMLSQLGVFPPSPAVGSRLLTWRLNGKAKKAALEVSAAATLAASAIAPRP